MRVIGGVARGHSLKAVPGDTTRPVLDRIKAALFDILRPELAGISLLDLFAGSGAIGIEALSQGADHCVFTEIEKKAVQTIQSNLEHTKLKSKAQVIHRDAFRYLRNTEKKFDLIYIAPPQYQNLWLQTMQTIAERPEVVCPNGKLIVQIDPKEYEATNFTDFDEVRQKKYGNTLLVFYNKTE